MGLSINSGPSWGSLYEGCRCLGSIVDAPEFWKLPCVYVDTCTAYVQGTPVECEHPKEKVRAGPPKPFPGTLSTEQTATRLRRNIPTIGLP